MPRFHFHVRDCTSLIADGEGVLLYDVAAAIAIGTKAIREQVAIDIRTDGVARLGQTMDIVDPQGALIKTLDYAQIIQIDTA